MLEDGQYFEFRGLRFLPNTGVLKVAENGKEISLSDTQRRFLLALLERAGDLVSYEDLRQQVWPHETNLDRRVQHTIHVTKRNLVTVLEGNGVKGDFIEAAPGKGYRVVATVNSSRPASLVEGQRSGHRTYVGVVSVLYGFLFWIALVLEVAYKFNLYGSTAIWLGLFIWTFNSLALLAACALVSKRLRERRGDGLFIGLSILVLGVIGACGLAAWFLPRVPITESTLQAQPALAAFVKNALVYFLPLGVFFLLNPFYFVVATELKAQRVITAVPMDVIFIRPKVLLIITLGGIVYSLVTTFYMLDHLQPGPYHGLFISLIFVRFLVFFGLAVGSTLWYKAALAE